MGNCKEDGCDQYVIRDSYCAKHFIYHNRPESRYESIRKRYPWQKLYYRTSWKKLRELHLSKQPMCVMCGNVGSDVDHIIDHKGVQERFFDADNLQTLCRPCHAKKTFADDDFYKLPDSTRFNVEINLVDKSDCDMTKLMKSIGVDQDTDYLYKLLSKSNDNIYSLSKNVYIIKLYKLLSIKLGEKPKLKSNSTDILDIL